MVDEFWFGEGFDRCRRPLMDIDWLLDGRHRTPVVVGDVTFGYIVIDDHVSNPRGSWFISERCNAWILRPGDFRVMLRKEYGVIDALCFKFCDELVVIRKEL